MNCIRLSRLLAVIIVCLLVIGAVSGTIVRHIVQLIPIFAALCLALAGRLPLQAPPPDTRLHTAILPASILQGLRLDDHQNKGDS